MDIESIINAIRNKRVRITDHADEEALDDGLSTLAKVLFQNFQLNP